MALQSTWAAAETTREVLQLRESCNLSGFLAKKHIESSLQTSIKACCYNKVNHAKTSAEDARFSPSLKTKPLQSDKFKKGVDHLVHDFHRKEVNEGFIKQPKS